MLRICDACGEVDDGPRHVIGFEPDAVQPNTAQVVAISSREDLSPEDKERIVADIIDTTLMLRHMHCCRDLGCFPELQADGTVKPGPCFDVPHDLRGDELRAHITGGSE